MNILHRIFLSRKTRQTLQAIQNPPNAGKKPTEHAFTVTNRETGETREYYRLKDPFDRPPLRHLSWAVRMNELQMGMDKATIQEFIAEIRANLDGQRGATIRLSKVMQLAGEMENRMILAPHEEQIYWLAAVEYFEEGEDIIDFNFDLNKAKIDFWKSSETALDFFLRKPVAELIGWNELSRNSLADHLDRSRIELHRQKRVLQSRLESHESKHSRKIPNT
jgi:hypothetical protein